MKSTKYLLNELYEHGEFVSSILDLEIPLDHDNPYLNYIYHLSGWIQNWKMVLNVSFYICLLGIDNEGSEKWHN